MSEINMDAVIAAVKLVDRAGGKQFETGFLNEEATNSEEADWWASALFMGAKITASHHSSPSAAAQALAEKLLKDATCRCGKTVSLSRTGSKWCRWKLMGDAWTPGCDSPPISGEGLERGDVEGMRKRMEER